MSERENVLSRIDISIMRYPTVGAPPFSYSKTCSTFRTVDGNTPATRTRLGTVRFIDFQKHGLHRFRFISCVFSRYQPTSKTDLAILVLARPELLTLPTTINEFSRTSLVVNLWIWSDLRFFTLAWMAFTRFFLVGALGYS